MRLNSGRTSLGQLLSQLTAPRVPKRAICNDETEESTESLGKKNMTGERAERWRREDAAPRLLERVPSLQTLILSLNDLRGENRVNGTKRMQHVIVARAAALFEIPCSDPKCQNGGYDVTSEVLSFLRLRRESFAGVAECGGMVGHNACRCSLSFAARASYGLTAPFNSPTASPPHRV